MIVQWGLYGGLLTLAINQSLVFFVTLSLCYRTSWFKLKYLVGGIDKQVAINLSKYTAMLTSAATAGQPHLGAQPLARNPGLGACKRVTSNFFMVYNSI